MRPMTKHERARRMYEVELLTVREIAQMLDLSFEDACRLLAQAGTRFRP